MNNKLLRFINNLKGTRYGGCHRCKDRWNWKKYHSIQLTTGRGIFPLCEECWEETGYEERLKYCIGLWYSWKSPNRNIDEFIDLCQRALRKNE